MLRFGIYARVSTTEQAEKGYSLDTQLEASRKKAQELAGDQPYAVQEFIDDGYSGEFLDRPNLSRMREAIIAKNFDYIIVYDPDRLARNLGHQMIITEDIEKANGKLEFVSVSFEKSPEGDLFYTIRGAISAYEKEKIKERTLRGKKGKALNGKLVSNGHPFGYSYDAKNSMYVINENQAEVVRLIYKLITKEKKGTSLICRELNALGIPSPRSKSTWIVSSVYRIITNTLYKGTIYSMKYRCKKTGLKTKHRTIRPESEWIPIQVPAIISEDVWEAAQKQLKVNKSKSKRNLKRDHLLTGLVYCSICGRKMTVAHSGSEAKSYYVCLSQKSAAYTCARWEKCSARRVPTNLLDKYIFDYLKQQYYNPDLISAPVENQKEKNKDTELIEENLNRIKETEKKLTKERETIMRWFRQQMISESEADLHLKEIQRQLSDVNGEIKRYQEEYELIAPKLDLEKLSSYIEKKFNENLHSYEDKRLAIQSVLDKVSVQRTDNTLGRGSKPLISISIKYLPCLRP